MFHPALLAGHGDSEEDKQRPTLEVADIFRHYHAEYQLDQAVSYEQQKAINAILQCRTAALGGHVDQCDQCGAKEISYNSCRNRHCPKCQTIKKLRWIKQREAELLPVPYFHVVFTLPHELNALVRSNQPLFYNLLFKAVSETLLAFGRDTKRLGGEVGATLVLHTWGQNVSLHPHIHCIVPGGALTNDSRWIQAKSNYLFPVKAMARYFRARYLKLLFSPSIQNKLKFHGKSQCYTDPSELNRLKELLWQKNWVVYAKKPFAGPKQIINYLSNYTHRIALSNHRLIKDENGKISFYWRDYSDENKTKIMTLDAKEFMRRYLQHVLPSGFTRIRQIGFLANRYRTDKLNQCRAALNFKPEPVIEESIDQLLWRVYQLDIHRCTHCETGTKKTIGTLPNLYEPSRGHDTS
jgi:predicted Zn-ribbon and HTH transcriptional regulator